MSSDFSDQSDSDYIEENEDEDENGNEEEKKEFPRITTIESVPEKSKTKYLNNYDKFKDWCAETKNSTNNPENYQNELADGSTTAHQYSEPIFLEYFTDQSKILKPSSLWVMYSMLRMMMLINHQIDLSKYQRLKSMLRQLSTDYEIQKPALGAETKIFEKNQITRFLLDAPDHTYLLCKVTLIFGIFGACGTGDFPRITTDDIHDTDDILIVTVPPSDRTFVIRRSPTSTGGGISEDLVDYAAIYRRYAKLRPPSVKTKRVFLNYQNGRCTSQVVGRNTFGKMPRKMAQFLKLPDYAKFTGLCFRKTAHAQEYYAHARYKSRRRSSRRNNNNEILQIIPQQQQQQQEQNPQDSREEEEEEENLRRIYDEANYLRILEPQNEEEELLQMLSSTPLEIKPTPTVAPSTTKIHFDPETNTLTLPGMTLPFSAVKSAAQTVNSDCAQLTINFYPLPEVPFCLDHVTYSCQLSSMEDFQEIYKIITQALVNKAQAQQNDNIVTVKSERMIE